MTRIALVDDDQNILESVSMALEGEGFEVERFNDGESGLAGLKTGRFDMAVLDIKMPRLDGMEVLKRLRQDSNLPVIFLTSKDDELDQLLGLKMGADDYITKPFSQRLLIERIRVVLRRAAAAMEPETSESTVKRGSLVYDTERHSVTWKGESLNLTVTEFLLLDALARRPGLVKSRDQLMDAAYDDSVYVDDRTIDSHIKRLRKKFKAVDDDFAQIETLYGVGYRYRDTE